MDVGPTRLDGSAPRGRRMNSEFLKGELDAAIEAELESDTQVRGLPQVISAASKPNSPMSASDASKIVSMTLAANERLREKTEALRVRYGMAKNAEIAASLPVFTGPKPQIQRIRAMNEALEKAKAADAANSRGDN